MFEVPEEGLHMNPSPAQPRGTGAEQLGAPEDVNGMPPPSPGPDGTTEQGLPDPNPLAEVHFPSLIHPSSLPLCCILLYVGRQQLLSGVPCRSAMPYPPSCCQSR